MDSNLDKKEENFEEEEEELEEEESEESVIEYTDEDAHEKQKQLIQENEPITNNLADPILDAGGNNSQNVEEEEEVPRLIENEENSKEELVNLLLSKKFLEKKPSGITKGKKDYKVESRYTIENLSNDPIYKSNGFYINKDSQNPEFTTDFSTAKKKILSKMSQDGEKEKLLKILISDQNKLTREIESLQMVKKDYIDTKVKSYLSNKQKKKESIQEKLNEDFIHKHTFSPEINEKNSERRDLENFLNDQNKHLENVQLKVKLLKEEGVKNIEKLIADPEINENSAKIFQEKIKSEDPTHIRLYNKRFGDTTKGILKKGEKDKKETNISKTSSNNKERLEKLYQRAAEKKEKIEALKKKIEEDEKKKDKLSLDEKENNTNKVLLENLMKEYKSKIEEILGKEEENNLLTYDQIRQVLKSMTFCKHLDMKEEEKKEENEEKTTHHHMKEETTKLSDLFNALKNQENMVSVDVLFIFFISVLNLYEYFLFSSYKKTTETSKENENEEKSEVLNRISAEIESKIHINTRYGAFDENGKFLVTLQKAKNINKDFRIFYINYMNRATFKKKKKSVEPELSYRPEINQHSNRLYSGYRNKVIV
jgi:hypothetical protein